MPGSYCIPGTRAGAGHTAGEPALKGLEPMKRGLRKDVGMTWPVAGSTHTQSVLLETAGDVPASGMGTGMSLKSQTNNHSPHHILFHSGCITLCTMSLKV